MNTEEAIALDQRVRKLYRRKRELFVEEVHQKKEALEKLCGTDYGKYRMNLSKIQGWHAIWCIVSHATLAFLGDIPEDVEKEAYALLDIYERSKMVDHKLVKPQEMLP